MSKEVFLNALRMRLSSLPQKEIDERVSFYEEMIEDRIDEGKTEEEAINEIGTVDEIVEQIASETPLVNLVKERIRPKRRIKAWEIVLIILGFPFWFPLVIVALILSLVFYLLMWLFVIITYTIEAALTGSGIYGFIAFFMYLFGNGEVNISMLGMGIMCLGASVLFVFLTGKAFTTKTSTGRPNVPPSTEGHGTCSLETSTGNINISINQ